MPDDFEFSINASTLSKILNKKKENGFEDKSWDDWFEYFFNLEKENTSDKKIEKIMNSFFQRNDLDLWIQNFALNLDYIWQEKSARSLDPTRDPNYNMNEHSAIVIGRGPSIKKNKHLELLADSNYDGSILCTDGALITALQAGITPDKFKKFYVVTIDAYKEIRKLYDNELIDKYGSKIKGIFSTLAHPITMERVREAQIQIYWLHPLMDFNEGKKSLNKIFATMVRAKNHLNGLPAIQTGGNGGTSSWFIGWQILKCSTIALIGINHGWEEDDPVEKIISHGSMFKPPKLDIKSSKFERLFPKIYNPHFNSYCILDPIFQFYSSAFKEFIIRSPFGINTINATEGGSIFGERISSMTFENFLNKFTV